MYIHTGRMYFTGLIILVIFNLTTRVLLGCPLDPSLLFQTCSEVKAFSPGVQDGDFWLAIQDSDGIPHKTLVYCHNMAGTPKEYITLPAGPADNFAMKYGPRLNSGWQCNSGLKTTTFSDKGQSSFSKIRIDVMTLTVNKGDYTFATTTNNQIPYGIAGDCYSETSACRQGKFKIHLSGTGFYVDSTVQQWSSHGFHASMEDLTVSASGEVVTATCGGWCGGCKPVGNQLVLDLNGDLVDTTRSGQCLTDDIPSSLYEISSNYILNLNPGTSAESMDILMISPARSRIHCAIFCNRITACASVIYNLAEKKCILLSIQNQRLTSNPTTGQVYNKDWIVMPKL